MEKLIKILTAILGGMGTVACLLTIGIFGYALTDKESVNTVEESDHTLEDQLVDYSSAAPRILTELSGSAGIEEISYAEHTHNYIESVDIKANCYGEGRLKYICDICGDTYYIDEPMREHKEDPNWVITRKPTLNETGLRVKYCIYCDSIVVMEDIPYLNNEGYVNDKDHTHNYTVTTEREPTCVFAGLRKYTCSCGDVYSEQISAPGHVAAEWTTVEEPTTTTLGAEQRICTVCGVVLDLRRLAVKETVPKPTDAPAPTNTPRPTNIPWPTITPTPPNMPTPTGSPSYDWQKKVIDATKNYLRTGIGYSYEYLINILENYEKFTHEQAVYGVDNSGADWNDEAVKSAKNFLKTGIGYSHAYLIDILENHEKFTHEQAVYGVDNSGADWNDEAVKSAKNHLGTGIEYTYESLIDMLEKYEKFTHEEAVYGADNCGTDW